MLNPHVQHLTRTRKGAFAAIRVILLATAAELALLPGSEAQAQETFMSSSASRVAPAVRSGVLSNGFSYNLIDTRRQSEPTVIRVIVDAGTLDETEAQTGLAHLLEHVIVASPTFWPRLRDLGLTFGNDVNAATGGATSYIVTLRPDHRADLDEVIDAFSKTLFGLKIAQDTVDQEKPIVLEEFRKNLMSSQRVETAVRARAFETPCNLGDALERHNRSVASADAEQLQSFYDQWYRPERTRLVIAGGLDLDQTEAAVRTAFGSVPVPSGAAPASDRQRCVAAIRVEPQYAVVATPDVDDVTIHIIIARRVSHEEKSRPADVLDALVERVISERLQRRLRSYSSPYSRAGVNLGMPVEGNRALRLVATLGRPEGVEPALEDLLGLLADLSVHGVSATELDAARADIRQSFAFAEPRSAATIATAFLNDPDSATAEISNPRIPLERLDAITLADLNVALRQRTGLDAGLSISVVGASRFADRLPDGEAALAIVSRIREAPPREDIAQRSSISTLLSPDAAAALKRPGPLAAQQDRGVGVQELRLSNGLRVLYRKTVSGPVNVSAIRLRDHPAPRGAESAAAIAMNSGAGGWDRFAIQDYLDAREIVFGAVPGFVGGWAPVEQLEPFLQMFHIGLLQPTWSDAAFREWADERQPRGDPSGPRSAGGRIETLRRSHDGVMSDQTTPATDIATLSEAMSVFDRTFGDLSAFTVVVTAPLDMDRIQPLLEQYLGTLPSQPGQPPFEQRSVVEPGDRQALPGRERHVIRDGAEGTAEVQISVSGRMPSTPVERLKLDVLASALRIRMLDLIRVQNGGSYTPNAAVTSVPRGGQPELFRFTIQFDCAPEQAETLKAIALAEIEKLAREGLDSTLFQEAIAQTATRNQGVSPNTWSEYLQAYAENPSFDYDVDARGETLNRFTREEINAVARDALDLSRALEVIRLPSEFTNPPSSRADPTSSR